MNFRNVRCSLVVTKIPPGHHLVGLQPQNLFRLEHFELGEVLGLFLNRSGCHVPFDGKRHTIEGYDRTLSVGNFLALALYNETDRLLDCQLTLEGKTVDVENPGWFVTTGLFVNEEPAAEISRERVRERGAPP